MGRIGTRYALLAHGIGARVVYASRSSKPEAEGELGARRMELRELLEASDVVSIHAPSTPETRGLIGAAELELIGSEGVLVNTSRGPLVDSEAVAAALEAARSVLPGWTSTRTSPRSRRGCWRRRGRCCCRTSARRRSRRATEWRARSPTT